MKSNPSRTLGDVEAQAELPVVQIVPEASVQEFAVETREAFDRPREIRFPENVILVGIFGQEIVFLKVFRANWPHESQRLVARDA